MKLMVTGLLAGVLGAGLLLGCTCSTVPDGFEKISENGFDAADNAADWNDYPWAMSYFTPDGKSEGQLFVGTGNGIDEMVLALFGVMEGLPAVSRPPEIRRFRPDQGTTSWERVFDFRNLDAGPEYAATGFRSMAVYRAQSDGVNYLYAGTFGTHPLLLRSATGEPDSWTVVWEAPDTEKARAGLESIRWMTVHNGLLYIAITKEFSPGGGTGQILASDGDTVWPVMEDGFGNPDNLGVMSLISWNGWLYAGTANAATGFEIWRFAGPGGDGESPVKVVGNGGTDSRNQAANAPFVFQDRLYFGSMIVGGVRFRGCDILRIDAEDNWEVIVGPDSLSGWGPGFNHDANAYIWSMEEHGGCLYAGTWDMNGTFQFVADRPFLALSTIPGIVSLLVASDIGDMLFEKRAHTPLSCLIDAGADLYRSCDGTHWEPVFTNGLGDAYNFGVRNMASIDGKLYLGISNNFDGLEIWRGLALE